MDSKPTFCQKGIRKCKWTEKEDQILIDAVQGQYSFSWAEIANKLPGRTGNQYRERWITNLSPSINRKPWSNEEDLLLIKMQNQIGNKWSYMTRAFKGRSSISIKNRWKWILRNIIQPTKRGQSNQTPKKQEEDKEINPILLIPPMEKIQNEEDSSNEIAVLKIPDLILDNSSQEKTPRRFFNLIYYSDDVYRPRSLL
ncbi:Myb-like DNA-binding domain containing protein [Trichomonas vaginalis G3]|uniref:Myb-like DNA-binding domain containing protein n=1 Tax=Trichomonas vaginalis (strain ATCC PRA-98 / G3) TaxID=412133 RepID=A2EZ43_TRIV3|nr:RNA polymerase II transcription regulator recruiting protein [Trichomonas vaginalis G3]EAY02092.1 Myb-like DNA-binding domain containing protein [Trichomonas vaginalis G3]KAI5512762.1 RNA polymerase II transcription regulator recruiting protein [Trichomonas vaginalis G3]|eukprot:XP_001330847.1 Myb-like DNA-binding domain containing protein [Trichomonas vaginalis G3]